MNDHVSEPRNEWPLWEIFIRGQHGMSHRHVGSLHAPDAEMAIKNARDVYTRRNSTHPPVFSNGIANLRIRYGFNPSINKTNFTRT